MPRLPHSLILRAYEKSPLLYLVLQGTRTLESAVNELRWLKEHVGETVKQRTWPPKSRNRLLKLCQRRSRGEPLQYILGSQPFGELDIKCRPGVLIPRPETEAYTTHLATLLNKDDLHPKLVRKFNKRSQNISKEWQLNSPKLRILDVCSGSGCISLLLHSLLSRKFPHLTIFGLDISKDAVSLANQNLILNLKSGHLQPSAMSGNEGIPPQVQFGIRDVLKNPPLPIGNFDIIISNPPYISNFKFNTETTRSVRNYEPRLALVPSSGKDAIQPFLRRDLKNKVAREDVFYYQLLRFHDTYVSKVLLMEVGDTEQAIRIIEMALRIVHIAKSNRIEVWRDWPDQDVQSMREINGHKVHFKGTGKVRAVVLFRTANSGRIRDSGRVVDRVEELIGPTKKQEKRKEGNQGWLERVAKGRQRPAKSDPQGQRWDILSPGSKASARQNLDGPGNDADGPTRQDNGSQKSEQWGVQLLKRRVPR